MPARLSRLPPFKLRLVGPILTVREFAFSSPEYLNALQLRLAVLRRPLNLPLSDADTAGEQSYVHIGAFEENEIIGVLQLAPLEGQTFKMRQVAVAEQWQGRGVGKLLVLFGEAKAMQLGGKRMVLHARQTAVPFYEGLGYSAEGELFEEVTMPHQAMYRDLT